MRAPSIEESKRVVLRAGHHTKRVVIGAVGGVILLAGIVMIVTPGPAILLIPAGIAILSSQFEWARRFADRIRHRLP